MLHPAGTEAVVVFWMLMTSWYVPGVPLPLMSLDVKLAMPSFLREAANAGAAAATATTGAVHAAERITARRDDLLGDADRTIEFPTA